MFDARRIPPQDRPMYRRIYQDLQQQLAASISRDRALFLALQLDWMEQEIDFLQENE